MLLGGGAKAPRSAASTLSQVLCGFMTERLSRNFPPTEAPSVDPAQDTTSVFSLCNAYLSVRGGNCDLHPKDVKVSHNFYPQDEGSS